MAIPRNELKYYINSADAYLLGQRLSVAMKKDAHTEKNRCYRIRSLYFEDPTSSSFFDNINGLEKRAKYRIRFYNGDLSYIRLEKKEKIGKKSIKTAEVISEAFAEGLISASFSGIVPCGALSEEVMAKIRFECFRPLLFVDYYRSAYLHSAGNVRITLDSAINGSLFHNTLGEVSFAIPVLDQNQTVLEIKYDSFLPPYIASLTEDIPKVPCAISKFCKCREVLF